jgi:putative lipoprotein
MLSPRSPPLARPTLPAVAAAALLGLALAWAPDAHGQDPARDPDPWFGRDKALHFGASAAIALGAYGTSGLITSDERTRVGAATGVALGAGVAKEIADRYTGGDPSLRDLTWDVVGTATGVLVAWLLDRFVF